MISGENVGVSTGTCTGRVQGDRGDRAVVDVDHAGNVGERLAAFAADDLPQLLGGQAAQDGAVLRRGEQPAAAEAAIVPSSIVTAPGQPPSGVQSVTCTAAPPATRK